MDTRLLNSLDFDDRFSIEFLYREGEKPLRVRVTFCGGNDSEESFELPMEALTSSAREAIRSCAALAISDWVQWAAVAR